MLKAIEQRRSVRKYLDQPVEEEKLLAVLEAARLAPSGSNTQPWYFIVVREDAMRQELTRVCHDQKWMLSAPVHIVCIADTRPRIPEPADLVVDETSSQFGLKQAIRDTAIAIEHLVLAAEEQDLGTCWIAWFTQDQIRPVLGIPGDKFVVAVITLGYPAESPPARRRKPLDEIVRYERW